MIYFEYFLVMLGSVYTPIFILNCFGMTSNREFNQNRLNTNSIITGIIWGLYFLIHNA